MGTQHSQKHDTPKHTHNDKIEDRHSHRHTNEQTRTHRHRQRDRQIDRQGVATMCEKSQRRGRELRAQGARGYQECRYQNPPDIVHNSGLSIDTVHLILQFRDSRPCILKSIINGIHTCLVQIVVDFSQQLTTSARHHHHFGTTNIHDNGRGTYEYIP